MTTIIITNLVDLVRFINKDYLEIIKVELTKGIYNEDVAKVTYKYKEEN